MFILVILFHFRLCFSLVLQNRTLDFYCTEEQINLWVIGLSEELKKIRPNAPCLPVGKFFWRKLALMGKAKLGYYLLGYKAKKSQFKTFVKALVTFKETAQDHQSQLGAS